MINSYICGMKIEVYKWFSFSSAGRFGWSMSLLSIFLVKEFPIYIQKTNKELFCVGNSLDWGFDEKRDLFYEGMKFRLILFFLPVLSFYTRRKWMTEAEYLEAEQA